MRYAMTKARRSDARTILPIIAAAALLCMVPSAASGLAIRTHRPNRSEQQQISQIEEDLRTALLAGDGAIVEKYLADDFMGISSNGKVSDKQQYVRRVIRHENRFVSIDVVDRKVRLQPPSTAVVISTVNITGSLDGATTHGTFRYTRVYNRQASGWKVVNFEATRVSGTPASEDLKRGIPVTR